MSRKIKNETDLVEMVNHGIKFLNGRRRVCINPTKVKIEIINQGNFDVVKKVKDINAKIGGLSITSEYNNKNGHFATYGISEADDKDGESYTLTIKPKPWEVGLWWAECAKEDWDIDNWFIFISMVGIPAVGLSIIFPLVIIPLLTVGLVGFCNLAVETDWL